MSITDVSPAQGPTSGGILVTITGRNLPEVADVYFGNRRAETVSIMAPTFIVVDVPPGIAGPVDVLVVDKATGEETVFPDGFTYIAEDADPVPPTTTAPTTTIAVTTTLGVTTTIPATTTSTSIAPTTSYAPTTAPPVVPPRQTLDDWLKSVLRTPEGLTLADPAPDDPMAALAVETWAGALCDEPVCPGWVLES